MMAGGRLPRLQQNFTWCSQWGRKCSWYGKACRLSSGLFLLSKLSVCLEVAAVEWCCQWVGRCIKNPMDLPTAAVHGSDAPCSYGAACPAAKPSGQGQEWPFFKELFQEQRFTLCLTRRKSVSAAPVCSWRAARRRRPFACLFSSPTRFCLALGIRCSGTRGMATVQGQNILLKYFPSLKMTVTSLMLLLACLCTRAKNIFLMCSVFLFMTWKAAHRAAYGFEAALIYLTPILNLQKQSIFWFLFL